jgi:acetyl esterase
MAHVKELDAATAGFLDGFSKMFASMENLSLPEQRATIKEMFRVPEDQLEPVAKVEDKKIPGSQGPIAVRLLTPKREGALPVIVFFHRGGWVYGSIQESEMICRRLANATGSIVVAVEYSLSPEHKFPVALGECYDAAKWVVENASSFSGNPSKVILCGESAGGNLAAAVALMSLSKEEFSLAGQLLVYPVLTSDLEKEHYDNSPDKSLLSYENMEFFWNMYLSSPEEGDNPLASPLKGKEFAGLPPCFVIMAEHDALKHEGASYAQALQKAGVAVQAKDYPGVIHGFLDLPLADATKQEAIADIATWVRSL